MTFNYELVNRIIDTIFPLPSQFGIDIEDGSELPDFIRDDLERYLSLADPDARLYHGVSKLVIVSPNLGGVVIKIPFNGWFAEYEQGNYQFYEFYAADAGIGTDYCLAEYETYQDLKRRHLNCFAARTLLYKKVCGFRVYIQEWTTPCEDDFEDHLPSPKSRQIAQKWKDEFYVDSEWIANCIDYYGEKKVEEFLHYCNYENDTISEDLHPGNYGYRDNGTPCLLDFSGFCDDM